MSHQITVDDFENYEILEILANSIKDGKRLYLSASPLSGFEYRIYLRSEGEWLLQAVYVACEEGFEKAIEHYNSI